MENRRDRPSDALSHTIQVAAREAYTQRRRWRVWAQAEVSDSEKMGNDQIGEGVSADRLVCRKVVENSSDNNNNAMVTKKRMSK